jgi:hypothetical protein
MTFSNLISTNHPPPRPSGVAAKSNEGTSWCACDSVQECTKLISQHKTLHLQPSVPADAAFAAEVSALALSGRALSGTALSGTGDSAKGESAKRESAKRDSPKRDSA